MAVVAGQVTLDAAVVVRCRRRVHLDHDPAAAESPRAEPDPALRQRRADSIAHREEIGLRLAGLVGAGVNGAGVNGAGVNGAGVNGAGVNGAGVNGAGVNGAGVNGAGWVTVAAGPARERQRATEEAMAAGAAYIWNALLPQDAGRRGDVDLLVRATEGTHAATATGGRGGARAGYRALIVVRHRISDPGNGALTSPLTRPHPEDAATDSTRRARSHPRDQLRLAHLTRMLEGTGHAAAGPAYGAVIGMDADVVIWHALSAPSWPGGRSTLAEYDVRFADREAVAAAALTGQPALAQPSRIMECRRCPWWPTCEAELTARSDVSLVLRGEDAAAVRSVGVTTVAQLAALDPREEPPFSLHGAPYPDAVALARAWLRGLPVVRRVASVRVPRADVEVDIDMESFGESGAYLWGALLSLPGGSDLSADIGHEPGYRAFATWEPLPTVDEARSFAEFWGWLSAIRARCAERGRSFTAYCYNEQAENRWMLGSADRFAGYPGMPTRDEVTAFISSDRWVDMFALVSKWFLCAQGKGLKRIAPVAGFAWADPEASGENSMRWYRDAVAMEGGQPSPEQRERLLRYNADDVHATAVLREWMCSPALAEIPLAGDL